MKYPTINKKELNKVEKAMFRAYKKVVKNSLVFDNKGNSLGLRQKDIDILAWNAATQIIGMIITT